MPVRIILFLAVLLASSSAVAQTIYLKYGGPLDISEYQCTDTPRSSFIRTICYRNETRSITVLLKTTWYAYCDVPWYVHRNWLEAQSLGKYYNAYMRGRYRCQRWHRR